MKWINKIRSQWGKPDPEEQAKELLEQAFNKFTDLIIGMGLPSGIVNTYKDAIVIQDIIDGEWEDKGIIGWTMIDHWKPIDEYFDPTKYEDPEEAYQMYKEIMEKPMIMIADVYEYENGTCGINMEDSTNLWFQDGHWYLI